MKQQLSVPRKFLVGSILLFLLLFGPFAARFIQNAQAGNASAATLAISDSRAGATSVQYIFSFTAAQSTGIKEIWINMCTTASGACTAPTGFNIGVPTLSTDTISGTSKTTSAPASNTFVVKVGTTATQSPLSVSMTFTGVTNPSTINTTFFGRITTYAVANQGSAIDTATVAAATLDTTSIAVSASIDPSMTFTIAGVTNGSAVDAASGSNTTIATTTTTVPFGTVTNGSTNIGAHDATISTNAGNGFTLYIAAVSNPPLTSGSNVIDNFCGKTGNTCSNTAPQLWSSPAGATANTNTGFFGYTTNSSTLCTGTAARFTSGGPKYAGLDTTQREVDCATAGVSSRTKRIGWRLEINGVQPAGSYAGTVTLVATPTY